MRARRPAVVAAAAALASLAFVAAAIGCSTADEQRLDVADEARPGPGAFDDLAPGWHDIDTGPVPPTGSSALTWTGTELTVLAAGRVFAYTPVTQEWRELPVPGVDPYGGAVVWLGDRLLVVDDGGSRSMTLRPGAPAWREHGPVPDAYAAVAGGVSGPSDPNGRPALIWTGEAVVDVTHGGVFEPESETWSLLPLPADPIAFAHVLSTNPVWDGHEVLLAYPHDVPGLAFDATGTAIRTIPGIDRSVVPDPRYIDDALAARLGDDVAVVRRGLTARFDARRDEWTVLPPVPGIEEMNGCPSHMASLGETVVVAPCYATPPVHLRGGEWHPVDGYDPVTPCCIGMWVGIDGALVVWDSDDDTGNNPRAPHVSARVWVPPET